MNCTGRVVEDKGHVARVLIESNACGDCHACGFGAITRKKSMEVNALNEIGAREDDTVALQVSGRKVMSASAILFLVPFGGFVAGFLLGYYPLWYLVGAARELIALVSGLALLAASYYVVHLLGKRSEFEFEIVEVVDGRKRASVFESPAGD